VIEINPLSSTYNPLPEPGAPEIPAAAELAPPAVADIEPVWSVTDVAVVALFTFCSLLVFTFIAITIASVIPQLRSAHTSQLANMPLVLLPPEILAYVAMVAFMSWLIRSKGGGSLLQAVHWRFPEHVAFYGLLGVGLALFIVSASRLLPMPKSLPIDEVFHDRLSAYLMMGFGVTLAPFFEELFFRGFLYPALTRVKAKTWFWLTTLLLLWPLWLTSLLGVQKIGMPHIHARLLDLYISLAISVGLIAVSAILAFRTRVLENCSGALALVGTAACFALIHGEQLGHAWAPLLVIFIVGLVLTVVRARAHSVGASFIVHAFYNATLFVTIFIGTNGFKNLDKIG
jgi:membrane protease YdiL (CAAX protease family)